jgi:hypothetical protein
MDRATLRRRRAIAQAAAEIIEDSGQPKGLAHIDGAWFLGISSSLPATCNANAGIYEIIQGNELILQLGVFHFGCFDGYYLFGRDRRQIGYFLSNGCLAGHHGDHRSQQGQFVPCLRCLLCSSGTPAEQGS